MAFETFTRDTVLSLEATKRLAEALENAPAEEWEDVTEIQGMPVEFLTGEEAKAFVQRLRKQYGYDKMR